MLWDQTGGSNQNIAQSFSLDAFADKSVSGDWTLTLADHAAEDTGSLNSWTLTVEIPE